MQNYDLTVLVQKSEVGVKIEKIIAAVGGKAGRMVDMGQKQLAYPIARQTVASYLSWGLELPPKAVVELEKKLIVDKDVLRHLLVREEK